MKEIQIGGRFGDKGLSFFGIEEVNDLLQQGFVVKELKGGGALFHQAKTDESGKTRMALVGFTIQVYFIEPNKS
ncbi:hypothetical protein GWO43_22535 [candidate division KSB1 bacterium]|nr:hypothetical protein [candidate division KSB1 bacterium]NIR72723.1 hypothetical protein [candidate division KSB1 bacterium]NIS26808.1 hypothetical protein [candidate division KSB1 bacterium]NIT73602.1 hypothetical protein [candidate division KSB1 bacterium]NIU27478.1 hypothetical protein [candidate division KSB1 bacterium]